MPPLKRRRAAKTIPLQMGPAASRCTGSTLGSRPPELPWYSPRWRKAGASGRRREGRGDMKEPRKIYVDGQFIVEVPTTDDNQKVMEAAIALMREKGFDL